MILQNSQQLMNNGQNIDSNFQPINNSQDIYNSVYKLILTRTIKNGETVVLNG